MFFNAFITFVYIFVGVKPWMSVPKPYAIKQQCQTHRFTTSKPWKPKKSCFHPFPLKKMIHLLVISQFAMKHGPLRGTICLRKMRNFPSPGSSGGTQLSGLRGISGIAGASWVSTVMGWGPGHESEGHGWEDGEFMVINGIEWWLFVISWVLCCFDGNLMIECNFMVIHGNFTIENGC